MAWVQCCVERFSVSTENSHAVLHWAILFMVQRLAMHNYCRALLQSLDSSAQGGEECGWVYSAQSNSSLFLFCPPKVCIYLAIHVNVWEIALQQSSGCLLCSDSPWTIGRWSCLATYKHIKAFESGPLPQLEPLGLRWAEVCSNYKNCLIICWWGIQPNRRCLLTGTFCLILCKFWGWKVNFQLRLGACVELGRWTWCSMRLKTLCSPWEIPLLPGEEAHSAVAEPWGKARVLFPVAVYYGEPVIKQELMIAWESWASYGK